MLLCNLNQVEAEEKKTDFLGEAEKNSNLLWHWTY